MDRFAKEKDIVDKLFNKDIYNDFNFSGKEYKLDKYTRRIVLVREDLEGKK